MSQSYFPITNQFTSTPLTAAPETLECETITVEEHTHMEAEDAAAAREILHAQNAPQAYLEEKDQSVAFYISSTYRQRLM